MNKVLLIAWREGVNHLRRPAFLFITFVLPLMGVMVLALAKEARQGERLSPQWDALSNLASSVVEGEDPSDQTVTVGYVDYAGLIRPPTVPLSPTVPFRAFPDAAAARRALNAGTIDAYYVLPVSYLTSGEVLRFAPPGFISMGSEAAFADLVRRGLLYGHDPRTVQRLEDLLTFRTVRLDRTNGQPLPGQYAHAIEDFETNPLAFFVPYGFALLLYLTIFSSSGLLLNSILEEKENRILEILLTSLHPWQLLGGKILGLGALGLGQMVIWAGSASLVLDWNVGGMDGFATFDLPAHVWLLTVPYFLLGYLVYGSLMAGIGSLVSTTREGTVWTTLLTIPVMSPLFFIMAITENPNGLVATVLSLIPLTASMTMVMRLTLTAVPWWHIVVSLLLLVGAAVGGVWVIARLFRAAMLLSGKRLTVGEVIRALRG